MKKLIAAPLLALALTGCGVQAGGDEVPVQFGGGVAEDSKVKGCKDQGAREIFGSWGDTYLKVPAGVRNYRARAGEVSKEQEAMTFTVNGVEMRSNVQVGYQVNLNCERPSEDKLATLEVFARDFGLKYERLNGDNWFGELLVDYVGTPTDQALDDAAAELVKNNDGLTWRSFRSDAQVKSDFETAAGRHAQALVEKEMGGQYFCGPGSTDQCKPLTVSVTPPTPTDKEYIDLIRDEEVAAGQVQIAGQQKLANDAKLKADEALREAYGVNGVLEQRRLDILEKAVEDGKVTVLPLQQGTDVSVPATP